MLSAWPNTICLPLEKVQNCNSLLPGSKEKVSLNLYHPSQLSFRIQPKKTCEPEVYKGEV